MNQETRQASVWQAPVWRAPSWHALRRRAISRIAVRMLAFNVLLVFLPVAGVLYLDTYEQHLLEAQERSMVQQGRLLAAALADRERLDAADITHLLRPLEQRLDSRLRVIGADGAVLGDTSRVSEPTSDREMLVASREPETLRDMSAPPPVAARREHALYRLALWVVRAKRLVRPRPLTGSSAGVGEPLDAAQIAQPAHLPEVQAALAGRYGSATRLTPGGQRSLTLSSALPIRNGTQIVGVVLVTQSTYRLLQALYDVRLNIFAVVIGSLAVAAVLTAIVSATIARPIRRLRAEAAALLDHRGRLTRRFRASTRQDEIGDLARALEELTRRLDEHLHFVEAFSADVSHEFKNPLASIRTVGEMLASVEDPAERDRFLAMLRRDVDRLERLLSGVREIVTIDAQLEREATTRVELGGLVNNVADAHRLRGDRVRLQVDVTGPAWVRGAPERLAQVFDNLVDNAIGFSPDRGVVTIRVSQDETSCRVAVCDEGPGIPETHLTRIFERFFSYRPDARAAASTATAGATRHHTGLGLAIAKAIVDGYGGSIAATNRSGRGACFEVRLPPVREPAG